MKSEQPKSAKANKDTWALWKFCETLSLEEISVLITKRRQDIKYETDSKRKTELRREISILEDTYEIIKRRTK